MSRRSVDFRNRFASKDADTTLAKIIEAHRHAFVYGGPDERRHGWIDQAKAQRLTKRIHKKG